MEIVGDSNACLKDLTIIAEAAIKETQPKLYPLIAGVREEAGAYTKIPVPANVPMPKLFDGERSAQSKQVNVVANYNQSTYELTIDLDSDLVHNAQAYSESDLVAEAVMSAMLYPDWLMTQAITGGTANNAYDGHAYYGATHKFANTGSYNISNLVTATGQTIVALQADLASALTVIRTAKDNAGRLLNPMASYARKNLVIHCPSALELTFRNLVFGTMNPVSVPVTTSGTAAATGSTPAFEGIAEVCPDGYLDADSASRWYLHYIGMPQKPFVFLENYGLQAKVLGFGTEFETNTNKVRIALKHRFVLGYYRFDRSVRVA